MSILREALKIIKESEQPKPRIRVKRLAEWDSSTMHDYKGDSKEHTDGRDVSSVSEEEPKEKCPVCQAAQKLERLEQSIDGHLKFKRKNSKDHSEAEQVYFKDVMDEIRTIQKDLQKEACTCDD